MLDEDVQDEILHSSIPSKDTYDEEDKVDALFSGNQCVAHAGNGNLDNDENNYKDVMSVKPTHQ
jgi:hypothetical protein